MHTRASAFRMQLSTWTGWLLSFLSACASGAKGTRVSTGHLGAPQLCYWHGVGSLLTSFPSSALIHALQSLDTQQQD